MTNMKHRSLRIIKNLIFIFLGTLTVLGGLVILWLSFIKLPDFSSFDSRKVVESTKIYDRTGEIVLYDLNKDVQRTRIPYTEMGVNIKNATVAIEDSEFYNHAGFRPKAFMRAVIANIMSGRFSQGGSTITQQVIKKSLLVDDKKITRKLKEIILALKLDQQYPKEEILAIYLNEIPYGGSIYGVAEATETFFKKKPSELTLAEAAYVASIPNAPTYYSPYGNNKDKLEQRKNLVLARMLELGFIDENAYNKAKEEVVEFLPREGNGIKAPHFVFYIQEYLENTYGPEVVESGGLKVVTTLDYEIQQKAEEAVALYTTGERKVIDEANGGAVVLDPKTGQILAMVGSRNYFDTEIDGNFNVTLARRQPGSSFKPYMYATALKEGYTPETILYDVPTEFNASCDPYHNPRTPGANCYMPQNYNGRFNGPLTMRSALARSLNVPAVKMLYMVGVRNAVKTAEDMGITTLTNPDRYGLSLVLGGGEVRLLEMTSAYGVFAVGGIRTPHTGILRVEGGDGVILESYNQNSFEVLPKNVALQINSMLSDNPARTPTFGAQSELNIPNVAVKTGTTNDFKDSWTVGYTPSVVVGVWMGKNDNTSMPKEVRASFMWNNIMNKILPLYPKETFEPPTPDPNYDSLPPILRGIFLGNETFEIDRLSGGLATEFTPKETREEKVITNIHSILYWIKKNNPTQINTGGQRDSLYENFETAVQNWWNVNKNKYPVVTEADKPTFTDSIHTLENKPKITLTSPLQGSRYSKSSSIPVSISATGTFPLQKIDIFLNNTFIGTKNGNQPSFIFTPQNTSGYRIGDNTLTIVGTDTVYNSSDISIQITITE